MKQKSVETWTAGNGKFFAYTENKKVKAKLEKLEGVSLCGTYQHLGKSRIFAWQFVLPNAETREMIIKQFA